MLLACGAHPDAVSRPNHHKIDISPYLNDDFYASTSLMGLLARLSIISEAIPYRSKDLCHIIAFITLHDSDNIYVVSEDDMNYCNSIVDSNSTFEVKKRITVVAFFGAMMMKVYYRLMKRVTTVGISMSCDDMYYVTVSCNDKVKPLQCWVVTIIVTIII